MSKKTIDVYIKLPTGKNITNKFAPADAVKVVCQFVAKELSVEESRVRLQYQGKFLGRQKTLGYLGVRPETILKCEVVRPCEWTLTIKPPSGDSFTVHTQNVLPFSDFCHLLEVEFDMKPSKHIIKFQGNTIYHTDKNPLFEFGIRDESAIEFRERAHSGGACNIVPEPVEEDPVLKETILSSFQTQNKPVEVVFSFDTTGSMSVYLQKVRDNLQDACRRLLRDVPSMRIGLIAHGDYCDQKYVICYQDLTSNVDDLVKFAMETPSTGGGDCPECYELVLKKAQELDWAENSAKALVVIGDAEPHPPSYTDQSINWRTEMEILIGMGVKIYGVYCNRYGSSDAKLFYEEIAEKSSGCFLSNVQFNLITEMFLAVCYKESTTEQLDAYQEEMEKEGKMTEDTKQWMEQLKSNSKTDGDVKDNGEPSKSKKNSASSSRKCTESWWDVKYDKNTTPSYKYDQATDNWYSYKSPNNSREPSPAAPMRTITLHSERTTKKRKFPSKKTCSIM